MFFTGLGTAAPLQRYAQRDCWDASRHSDVFARLTPRLQAILKKVLSDDNGINTRHLAPDPVMEVFDLTPDAPQPCFVGLRGGVQLSWRLV